MKKDFGSITGLIIGIVVATIIFFGLSYILLPEIGKGFTSIYVILSTSLFIVAYIASSFTSSYKSDSNLDLVTILFFVVSIALLAMVGFRGISSSSIFKADEHQKLLGEVKSSDFSKDVSPIDINNLRMVDEEMASRLGDKKIGEDPSLGSVAEAGTFNIQSINGKLYWVAPLTHRSIFKWAGNLDGTSGYIIVSATNAQDVQLVQKDKDGKPIKIVYQPKAFFNQDLHRHIYSQGYKNVGLTDFTFEIDDNGKPYWVVTTYKKTIGTSGDDATGVLTVDVSSGDIKEYSIKDAPKWIDRIQPEDIILSQIKKEGTLKNGFINSIFGQKNVLKPSSSDLQLVYSDDGQSYWYTGITSAGADDSTTGFMLVNTRTKEAKYYKQPGATEDASRNSLAGKYPEKDYTVSSAVMYNVSGVPTYFATLKDGGGLAKMVGFVSVEDYTIVGVADNKEEALREYRNSLSSKGNKVDIKEDASLTTIEGTITRLSPDIKGGQTFYYFNLDNNLDKAYVLTSSTSKEIPLTREGDKVKVSFVETNKNILDVSKFDNLNSNLE